jgi:hypothetical protein
LTLLDRIAESDATLSENLSRGLFAELIIRPDWRCYFSHEQPQTQEWADKFVTAHARIPSMFSGKTIGLMPMMVLRYYYAGGLVEGWVYLNGAVVVTHSTEDFVFLFVDEPTAQQWNYPDEFFRYHTLDKGPKDA